MLVRVTVLAALVALMTWLPKSSVDGVRKTAAGAEIPVPASETICGLSLLAMLRAALSVVVVLGVKITVIVQVLLAARVVVHVVVPSAKSDALVPVKETAILVMGEAELLNSVTVSAELGVLTI